MRGLWPLLVVALLALGATCAREEETEAPVAPAVEMASPTSSPSVATPTPAPVDPRDNLAGCEPGAPLSPLAPGAPANVRAELLKGEQVVLRWDPPPQDAVCYTVEGQVSSGPWTQLMSASPVGDAWPVKSGPFPGLNCYRLYFGNQHGRSPYSEEACVEVPAPPTPTPTPAYSGPLKVGVWVEVNTDGECLNARTAPGLGGDGGVAAVLNCLPDGFVGYIVAGPEQADGHWWWNMAGQGWVAEDWLRLLRQGDSAWPQRPELKEKGLIAYVGRDGNIWLMNADGSNQRRLTNLGEQQRAFMLQWSPQGDKLLYSQQGPAPSGDKPEQLVRILDLKGQVVAEIADAQSAFWSPDARKVSYLAVIEPGGLGGVLAVPSVLDLGSSQSTAIAPAGYYLESPRWSPEGKQLIYICQSSRGTRFEDGKEVAWEYDCGGDGLRLVDADGKNSRLIIAYDEGIGWANWPNWSPDGRTIALRWFGEDCRGYVVYDIKQKKVVLCSELPPAGGFGGRCGFVEDGQTDWTPDGGKLLYHSDLAFRSNGVWVVDVATGDKKLIPAAQAAFVTVAPDSRHLAFSTWANPGYIWAVDIDGKNLTLLAEGSQPAWQPRGP